VTQECPIHAPRWREPYRQKAIRLGQNGCAARDSNPEPADQEDEHRLVYRADGKEVKILKARYHYGND